MHDQELYEPLWEEIYARSKANGFRIRSIWMADVAHQGQSSVLNEDLLGNDRALIVIGPTSRTWQTDLVHVHS